MSTLSGYELTEGTSQGGATLGVPFSLYGGSPSGDFNTLMRELAPTIATGFAGGAAWAAFALFGKRRSDDDEPVDGRMAAAAASPYESAAVEGLQGVDESTMPRWRRPSLQQVRRTDPLRAMAEAAPHMSFESAGVRPLENFERRQIGYRLVRLLDSPDELRAREIGIVDQGDEVQLLERHGVYWLVLCPDGRQGWIHRMTLAEPTRVAGLADDPEPMPQYMDEVDPAPAAEYAEYQPEYPGDQGVDGLLEAYMTARRDVLKTMAEESADGDAPVLEFQGTTFAAPAQYAGQTQYPAQYAEQPQYPIEYAEPEQPAPDEIVPPEEFAAAVDAVVAFEFEPAASPVPAAEVVAEQPSEPPSAEPLAASPARAGERYSARKSAGTHKAATASRPGTKSRRPSR
jgi:hypothetical protein